MTQDMICYTSTWFYDKMKPKDKKFLQERVYFNLLFDILLSMFEWENLPDSMPAKMLDAILCSTGQIAVGEIDGKLTCAPCSLGGDVDAYGLGSEVIAPTPIGNIEGKRNDTVAWGINNQTGTPDNLIYWIASMMAECDTSASLNVLYTRLTQLPVVHDEKQKTTIENVFKGMIEGRFGAVISDNIFSEMDGTTETTLELTDANKIDRIQYLSRFYDDLLKRFCNYYGQPLQTQNKLAQTHTDEIHGMDSFSFIIPLDMLRCRRELCDNINRIFGTDISVSFSKSWEAEFTSFINRDMDGDGQPDLEDDQTEDQTEDQSADPTDDQTDDPTDDQTEDQTDDTTPEKAFTISADSIDELLELVAELEKEKGDD